MKKYQKVRFLLRLVRSVDRKCDIILNMLDIMRDENKDTMLDSIKESARDMYASSLEERRRANFHD